MSLTLVNKLYEGKLFIWKDNSYLVNSIVNVNDKAGIINTRLVKYTGEIIAGTFTFDEFLESVVK